MSFFYSTEDMAVVNFRKQLKQLDEAITACKSIAAKRQVQAFRNRIRLLLNDAKLMGFLSSDDCFQKTNCGELIKSIEMLSSSCISLNTHKDQQGRAKSAAIASSDKAHKDFAAWCFFATLAFLVAIALGYIAFLIAFSVTGHAASVVYAHNLFFDITGYGFLGSAALAFFSALVFRPLVNLSLKENILY